MPRTSRLLLVAVAVGSLITLPARASSADTNGVTTVPVAFQVTDTNTSDAPCLSDGAAYTIRGHLTGPASTLTVGHASAVTLYLFGYDTGEWNWTFTAVPGYDYGAGLGKLGHVSLTLDELGYGASGHPVDGNLTCIGAEADITHQIIGKLRSGDYSFGGGQGISFSRVVVAGHDIGAQVGEVEAYSYSDIDGLVIADWSDQGQTPFIIQRATVAASDWCTLSPAQTSPGQPTSYVRFATSQDVHTILFYDADPRVIDAFDALRNPNPCGIIRSAPQTVTVDQAHYSKVTVPVLMVYGDHDTAIWTHQGEQQQQADFSGSKDKTTAFISNAGHLPMFEKTAPEFRQVVAAWLQTHDA